MRPAAIALVAAAVALYVRLQVDLTHFQLAWLYPYALMWTGDRQANVAAWLQFAPVNKNIVYPPMPVPEIMASDYSFESLREATRNFRLPAIVRGFFNNTRAVDLWSSPDYLNSKLGDFLIPIVKNGVVGTMQDDRMLVTFSEAFSSLYAEPYSKRYIFFPVKSRFTFNGSTEGNDERLQQATNDLCRADLDLDRIFPGFASPRHTTFLTCQMIIGKSTSEIGPQSIGSDWHCAGGNNWFAQVSGAKDWEFIEPRYSAYLAPLKGGAANMWTGYPHMADIQRHIPRWKGRIAAGDLLYNPDWMWHKVINLGGLSIAAPVREVNVSLTFQNNLYFTLITMTNKLLARVLREKSGLVLPGYPPPSLSTEADN